MADVIQLHKQKENARRAPVPKRRAFQERARALPSVPARRRLPLWGAVAAVLVCVIGGGSWWWLTEANAYVTKVGEQRSTKLADGSFIYLNTDSKVEVNFSDKARSVRLVRGEAMFVVEHDSSRPFTVTAGETSVRALGTQFNVRRRSNGADVAVVEGTVQVTALDEPQQLAAGEETQVVKGRIAPKASRPVAEAVAWRQRRLVFHDAKLADVADEFNRYNRTKIRIEGDAARDIQLSGIFDADRPQALMLYAAKNAEFSVEPEGNDWVIRGR
jgi:transmembrane sensor